MRSARSTSSQDPVRALALTLSVAAGGVFALWLRWNAAPPVRGTLYPHDLLYSYLPKMELVGSRLARAELPLWNPYGCAGVPLLASLQPAVLYPPTWISALLPAELTLSLLTLFHLVLGGAGAALLFRRFGVPPTLSGAFAGVFIYACGLGQTFWPPQVATLVWLPWILLCIDRVAASARVAGWWLALVLASALQLLAGFPQYVLYTLQIAAPFGLWRSLQRGHEGGRAAGVRSLVRIVAAMALGAGVAAAQLLPAAELIGESDRAATLSEQQVQYLQREARLEARLSNAVTPADRLMSFEITDGAGYIGIATLVLILVALVGGAREPLVWGLAVCGVGFFVLADGYVGIGRWAFERYASIPLVGSLRSPERLLFLAYFCAVALAALGARVCDRAGSLAARGRAGAGLAAGVAAAAAIAALGNEAALWRATAVGALVAAAFWLPASPGLRSAWRGALAVLVLADVALATGAHGSLRALPRGWSEVMHIAGHPILTAEERASRRARAGLGRIEFVADGMQVRPVAGVGPLRETYRLACYETPILREWALARRITRGGDPSAFGANVDPDRFAAFLDLSGVVEITQVKANERLRRTLNIPGPRYSRDAVPREPLPDGAVVVRRANEDALPRAYLVDRYRIVHDDEAILRAVTGSFDYRSSVLLDGDPGLDVPENEEPNAILPADILSYEPERVEISVRSPREALLVLTDTHYPGWYATVDGSPAKILRANAFFRAVRVPTGEHLVVFRFAPTSLRTGVWISGTSILLALAIPFVVSRRR